MRGNTGRKEIKEVTPSLDALPVKMQCYATKDSNTMLRR